MFYLIIMKMNKKIKIQLIFQNLFESDCWSILFCVAFWVEGITVVLVRNIRHIQLSFNAPMSRWRTWNKRWKFRKRAIPRECTDLRVPIYWESLNRVSDVGTGKFSSIYTDVDTLSSTHTGMFTKRVLLWIPKSVNSLRKA